MLYTTKKEYATQGNGAQMKGKTIGYIALFGSLNEIVLQDKIVPLKETKIASTISANMVWRNLRHK